MTCDSPGLWSQELLCALDWKRFFELVTLLLHRAGLASEVAWVRPDGAVMLRVGGAGGATIDSLVQCPGWASIGVDVPQLEDLHHAMLEEGAALGISATPGGFTAAARAWAASRSVELIDGPDLLRTLERMSPEEQVYYHRIATVGDHQRPSCPACGVKMELQDSGDAPPQQSPRDLTLRDRHFVSTEVRCRALTVKKGAEILFMKGVNAQSMRVDGRVSGNFVVNGRLSIGPGGCVSGLVSARAIQLDPGGLLEAEARILNARDLQPVRPVPVMRVWRCGAWPRCRSTLPLRHHD